MTWQVEVFHFNVNSGDSALLLATENGMIQKAILIDGGTPTAGTTVVLPALQVLLGNKTLDAIVVTHYDSDHYGGIQSLLEFPNFIQTFIKDNSDGIGTILYDNGDLNVKGRQCPYVSAVNQLNGSSQTYPGKLVTRIAAKKDASLLLGQDFMWLSQMPSSERTTESIATLRAQDKSINAEKPALYCIAINRKVLQYPQMLDLVPGDTSQQNMNSIALVLVSPDPENKICYYMAGDLTEEYESNNTGSLGEFGVAQWLNRAIGSSYSTSGMKLSHHGSQNSTPNTLMMALNPMNVIISAGNKHFHPSPMIILYLYLYAQYVNKTALAVMATNCPYYLNSASSHSIPWAGGYNTQQAITQLMCGFFPQNSAQIDNEIVPLLFNSDSVKNLQALIGQWNGIGTPTTQQDRFPRDLSPNSVNVSIKPIIASLLTEQAPVNNGSQIVATKKRKAPEQSTLFLMPSPSSQSTWTITSSNVVPAGDIPLVPNSDFDVFVSLLPTGTITLDACAINATSTIITGTISPKVDDIFYQSGVSSVTISLTGIKTAAGQYDFVRDAVVFMFQFAAALLGANQDIIFNGTLQDDNTLKMTLPALSAIRTNPILNGQFCGFLSNANDDAIVTSLGTLFLMLTSAGILLDPLKTQLNFDPTNNDTMELKLVSQLSPVNLLGKLNLSTLSIAFTSNTHVLNSTTLMQSSACEFNATLTLTTANFVSGITITLFPTGVGSFSITTSGNSVENLMNSFSQELLAFDCTQLFNDLNKLSVSFNEMQLEIMIRFDIIQRKILSVFISSDVTAFGYTFSTTLMLPDAYLCGGLSPTATDVSMNTLMQAHSIPEPSKDLIGFLFTGVSFAVSPSNGYYNFTAVLGDGNTSVWKFNSQINLEQLAISLTKNVANIQASLTAFLAMGSQFVSITGTYQSNDDESDWSFSAAISTLNLSDIASYVGIDIRNFPIQDLVLKNITAVIDVTNQTFAICAETRLGKLVFVINDQKTLFSLVLPSVNSAVSVPVVGSLPSIIDSLQLLYVSQAIQDATDPIIVLFQQQGQGLILPNQGLTAGLQIVAQFDSALGKGNTSVSLPVWQPTPTPEPSEYATALAMSTTNNTQSSTLWISINQTFGPLSLARLGISVSQGDFWLLFDASVLLGGLSLQLQGLGLGFSLDDLTGTPGISLSGLGLDYSTPTLGIEGDFLSQGNNAYQGSVLLSMENFMAAAIGAYIQPGTGSPSIFVYSRIDVPLGGPPFFYVMGFSGGFGYNMNLRIPTQSEVLNFPLVAGAVNANRIDLPSDMATMMTTLTEGDTPWLTTQAGAEWFAIGITFSTFELIYTQALIVAEFGSDPLFSLIGLSSMQLPKATPYPVAYAEMEMEALYDMNLGSLCMTALLSPNSYVLTPDCHLTGGFAFYTWFKNQVSGALAGDFVVTLGGYHPAFVPPASYPNVPRLGFNWQVSDQITINGDAYFALTPSSAMMGGALNASFNAGNLRAWFNAYADFLIDWHPFYYTASIGVSVGASYRLNLLFFTTTLSIEIGATLYLAGPPTHGNVYVDWYVISFSIPFGQQVTATPSTTWADFCQLLPSSSAPTSSSSVSLNRIMISSGLIQQDTKDSVWIVRPHGFSFYTLSAIPATTITFNGTSVTDSQGSASPDSEVNIKPMNLSSITHTHAITLDAPGTWTYTINETNVPSALWGVPSEPFTLDATLLPNRWTGVTVSSPPVSVGTTPGPISANILGEVSVNKAPLPLNVTSTQPIPQASTNSRKTIINTIATAQTNTARNQVISSLSALGLFKTAAPLDSMTKMAQNITSGQCFAESPLQGTFPSSTRGSFLS